MAQRVLVTGATGFIASHTVLALLEKGYDVVGTARSEDRAPALNATLSEYAGKMINIPLLAANLEDDDGWAGAITGCDYVLHIASPLPAVLPKDHDELIVPAREGALRVLKASKAAGVKRVVMTSSVAAIAYGWPAGKTHGVVTEEEWSDADNLKDNTAYTRSKTIAEKAAWEYVNGDGTGLELATVNPTAVLGPAMSGDFSPSLEIITQLMGGGLPAIPKFGFSIVDVRDVADLHVLAMEAPNAAGERFIASEGYLTFREVGALLRDKYPEYAKKIPKGDMPNWLIRLVAAFNPVLKQIVPEIGKHREANFQKAKSDLGWSPRSAEDAVIAAADSLIQHGVI